MEAKRQAMMQAMGQHVLFDGWSEAAFLAAADDAGVARDAARVMFPRGALDVAVALHKAGDAGALTNLAADPDARFRDRMAQAILLRLHHAGDRHVVRASSSLFALPQHMAEGAALIWGTADAIWTGLGDTSRDFNWYTKRASLAAVYSASLLFWLGNEDEAEVAAFVDRRIANVMALQAPPLKTLASTLLAPLRAPTARDDLPGRWG
ncbi:COQ9 family protein [Ketogulonicigenium vulgare]|uniref:COQ9 family protein n=1 Tax=Ketogulonicigenium vulgare TaxID=92945 RepID=UPI002358E40E|nr:COQ9 family protein [Ketogulonicigenium vulgare]